MSPRLPGRRVLQATGAILALAVAAMLGCQKPPPPPAPATREWQLLASELPSALMSVSGRSATDIYAVGADKGRGPLVLHFDGKRWRELHTHSTGDLWWVQAFRTGPVLMAGADATVLRFDGEHFERMPTPGLGRQTIYGVWGTDSENFYAVGSASGRDGFIWHYHGGAFEKETLPSDLPRVSERELPGFFKVFGLGDEVWVVGAGGTILHRKGDAPFTVVPTTTKNTLFTVHGIGDRLLVVGGGSNGVLLEGSHGTFSDTSPPGAGLIQGVFATDQGDWASGERGLVYTRPEPGSGPFKIVDHGLTMPATSSLHSIFVDDSGGVWSAGGAVLSPALDNGMLVHFGDPVPPVVIDEEEVPDAGAVVACPADVVAAGREKSIARRWDEQILAAIRVDLPRPPVHARNLFHVSAAMWDAWVGLRLEGNGGFRERASYGSRCRPSSTRRDQLRGLRCSRPSLPVGGRGSEDGRLLARGDGRSWLRPGRRARLGRRPHRFRESSRARGDREDARRWRQRGERLRRHDRLRPAERSARLRQPRSASERARALAAHQPGCRGDAERHHLAGGRPGLRGRAMGRGSARSR